MNHADGTCDATRCGECYEAETMYRCDVCPDYFWPEEGCRHDGRQLCASCLTNCTECGDAARLDDFVRD